MPVPRPRHQSPSGEDREIRRIAITAVVQALIREVLVVLLQEIWRKGP